MHSWVLLGSENQRTLPNPRLRLSPGLQFPVSLKWVVGGSHTFCPHILCPCIMLLVSPVWGLQCELGFLGLPHKCSCDDTTERSSSGLGGQEGMADITAPKYFVMAAIQSDDLQLGFPFFVVLQRCHFCLWIKASIAHVFSNMLLAPVCHHSPSLGWPFPLPCTPETPWLVIIITRPYFCPLPTHGVAQDARVALPQPMRDCEGSPNPTRTGGNTWLGVLWALSPRLHMVRNTGNKEEDRLCSTCWKLFSPASSWHCQGGKTWGRGKLERSQETP